MLSQAPQLTWSLTPHLRTGAFARAAAAAFTTDPLARGAPMPRKQVYGRCDLPLGRAMIAPRARGRLRGSLRPRLPWTKGPPHVRAAAPATTAW